MELSGVRSSCDMFATNALFSRFASVTRQFSASRSCSRCISSRSISRRRTSRRRLRSVTSRQIFEAPTIVPRAFRIGDTVSEISTELPSLRRRTVSK